jgi:GR25 family glycosyltransferase involved in LPS biosynthesis
MHGGPRPWPRRDYVKDGHVTNSLGRAVYGTALAARHVRPRPQSRSFGPGNSAKIGRIYVINLDRQTGRWDQIQRELRGIRDEHGVPLADLTKRLSAVDARYHVEPPPELVQLGYTLADQLYVDPHPLPAGVGSPAEVSIEMSREEVAVALSHMKAWELIAASDHEYGLVLEDDVYFRRDFSKVFDRAWSALALKNGSITLDLLYVSYKEARGGAEWTAAPAPVRRPVRGLWQLSGYVLSKRGAGKLLDRLPVRGPVDLWINFVFGDLGVFALRRPVIKQRLDVPSSNFYSALPVLSKVGLLTGEKAPSIERRSVQGPIFGFGERGTGVTALAMALSMLGYRCCSDVTGLPDGEQRALFDNMRPRVFDAYVNVGSLGPTKLLQLAKIHPRSKFIITASDGEVVRHDDGDCGRSRSDAQDEDEHSALQVVLRALNSDSTRCLIVPAGHHDKWQLLTEFLDGDYPSHRYPQCADQPRRSIRQRGSGEPAGNRLERAPLRWDSLPWIAVSDGWHGVPLIGSEPAYGQGFSERFGTSGESRWLLRDDTFPSNLALFSPSNFASIGDGAGRLTLRRERTSVRDYTSAALSTRDRYRYGRFAADLMPAKVSGLVTGMFLHRNAPRQEIDVEIVGSDTTKLLVNIYFNPGDEGTRLEYGYRGTPELIELGFDAADAFHRYEIDWTPESVRWRVDGELVCQREHWNPTPVPHLPMQFHVNLWHTRSTALAGRLGRRALPAHTYLRRVEVTSSFRTES